MTTGTTRFDLAFASSALVGIVTVGALFFTLGCGDTKQGTDHSREVTAPSVEIAPFPVTLATVGATGSPSFSTATGSLQALRKAAPGTKLMGRVEEVPVDEGQRVSKGQLLARIESRDLQAAIRKAEATVKMAEAQLQNASEQHERMKVLHQRGSVTDKNLEDARAGHRVASAQVETAVAGLEEARVLLSYATIRSPLSGWLIEKHLDVGDMVSPGIPAFVVEDHATLQVAVEISEGQLGEVEVGQPLEIQVAGGERSATVQRIVPSGNANSRTFTLEAELDNASGILRSGMFARVTWQNDRLGSDLDPVAGPSTVQIAASALVEKGQLQGVYGTSSDQQRLELRWVKTGGRTADQLTVLSGLSAGDRYVVDPSPELFDGAPYSVNASSTTGGGIE